MTQIASQQTTFPYWLHCLLRYPRIKRLAQKTLYLMQKLRLTPCLPSRGLTGLRPYPRWKSQTTRAGQQNIALFTGCLTPLVDGDTLHAAQQLCQQLSLSPHIIGDEHCCGALLSHHGQHQHAQSMVKHITSLAQPLHHIYMLADGCHAALHTHPQLAAKTASFSQLLWQHRNTLQHLLPKTLPIHHKPTLYTACSARFRLPVNAHDWPALLNNLFAKSWHITSPLQACCGAGGAQLLSPNTTQQQLAIQQLNHWYTLGITHVLIANSGCRLHLARVHQQHNPHYSLCFTHPATYLHSQIAKNK